MLSRFSACWEAELRARRSGHNCSCSTLPSPTLCEAPASHAWTSTDRRLAVAVSAHIVGRQDWMLLLRCLCSILQHHHGALILLTDNDSVTGNQAALAGRYVHGGRVVVCRRSPSAWSFGSIGWAAEAALSLGATHFAYLQHTMRLRRPLPLETLGARNCSFMNFQHFSGANFDTQERLSRWVLRAWVGWQ